MCPLNSELLTALECCPRKAQWSRQWEAIRIHPTQLLYRALRVALTDTERQDHGELAGEHVVELCGERGIDTVAFKVHATGIHHAVLADLLTSHLRPPGDPPWLVPDDTEMWQSRCYTSGNVLKRIILVEYWNEDRLAAECHSWLTLGEMAIYRMPMDLHVLILGQARDGRRHSAWTKGLLHPRFHKLRFKKKEGKWAQVWQPIWREEHDEISRETWLETMQDDGVLEDLSLVRHLELASATRLDRVLDDMKRSADMLAHFPALPPKVYSQCDWPAPCPFSPCCWGAVELDPAETKCFIPVSSLRRTHSRCSQEVAV